MNTDTVYTSHSTSNTDTVYRTQGTLEYGAGNKESHGCGGCNGQQGSTQGNSGCKNEYWNDYDFIWKDFLNVVISLIPIQPKELVFWNNKI